MYNGCVKENLTVINGVCADMLALEGFIRCNCNWNDNTLDIAIKDLVTNKKVVYTLNNKNFETNIDRLYKLLDEVKYLAESDDEMIVISENGYKVVLEVA